MLERPLSPSVTLGESTESLGSGSSSRIVPVPEIVIAPSGNVAFVGSLNCRRIVSSFSSSVSPSTVTFTYWTSREKVSVPGVTAE